MTRSVLVSKEEWQCDKVYIRCHLQNNLTLKSSNMLKQEYSQKTSHWTKFFEILENKI